MDKAKIIELFKIEIENNLKLAYQAAQNTYDIATHEDNKAENKYDTRGLEASYLAGAQAKRVQDLKETLTLISLIQVKKFNEDMPVALTALITFVSTDSEKQSCILLLPKGGGQNITYQNQPVSIVTPESPLGEALLGKYAGDVFTINQKEYEILTIA